MKHSTINLASFALVTLLGLSACDKTNTTENSEMAVERNQDSLGESGSDLGVKVEDGTITTKIKTAFLAESKISSLDINVTTQDGVVTLTGKADSLESSQKASEIASGIEDVKQVNNQLVIN